MGQHSALPPQGLRPVDPSGFSFHGFGDLTSRAERRLRRAGIRGGEPKVSVVEGAVFVPAVNRRAGGQGAGQPELYGGVVAPDGQPIDTAHLYRGRRTLVGGLVGPVAVAPEREVNEEAVYLGWLFDSFGHFLLESLARTWFLTEVDRSVRVVFHYPNPARWAPAGWALRILEAFGVPRGRILVPDAPTRFRRLMVPEPLFELQYAAHERAVRPYRDVAARIVGGVIPSPQPVYLSRRLLPSAQRAIVGEGELEDVLRENGFLIAHPETMAFADQVRLFNQHTDIFSSAGSAAHGVLFALGRPRLHLLMGGGPINLNFFLCSALAGAPTTFVNCLGTGGRPDVEDAAGAFRSTPDVVEMPQLVEYLDGRGFLKTRLRASLARRSPALRNEYDEAWFYARVRSATAHRETLPAEVEREAVGLAARSWPVSLILARYYARRDASRADGMAKQFAALAAAEFDMNRLARYRADVEGMAATVAEACGPETVARLAGVLSDRFLVAPRSS